MMALTTNYDHVYAESTSRYAGHDETDNQVRAVESVSYLCACLELEAVEGFAKNSVPLSAADNKQVMNSLLRLSPIGAQCTSDRLCRGVGLGSTWSLVAMDVKQLLLDIIELLGKCPLIFWLVWLCTPHGQLSRGPVLDKNTGMQESVIDLFGPKYGNFPAENLRHWAQTYPDKFFDGLLTRDVVKTMTITYASRNWDVITEYKWPGGNAVDVLKARLPGVMRGQWLKVAMNKRGYHVIMSLIYMKAIDVDDEWSKELVSHLKKITKNYFFRRVILVSLKASKSVFRDKIGAQILKNISFYSADTTGRELMCYAASSCGAEFCRSLTNALCATPRRDRTPYLFDIWNSKDLLKLVNKLMDLSDPVVLNQI